jgi:hypothetical protein
MKMTCKYADMHAAETDLLNLIKVLRYERALIVFSTYHFHLSVLIVVHSGCGYKCVDEALDRIEKKS